MFWWIVGGIILIAYFYAKFMEGYNSMDMPAQIRKQTKIQEEQLKISKEKEIEILRLKREIEELKQKK